VASEASEWEDRECEERLAFLREEEERFWDGGLGGYIFPSVVLYFSLVFHSSSFAIHLLAGFWQAASGRLRIDRSGATHP